LESVVIYKDLRGFIKQVEDLNALRHVEGADPHFEIGGITEVAAGSPDCPALLFDRIKGFPEGISRLHQRHNYAAARGPCARHRPEARAARRAQGVDGEAENTEGRCSRSQ
jgi:hypothetical protein